jgi:hypothetical protein
MSKLFEYAIKSYLKNLTWCGMPWNIQHIGQLHIQDTKILYPSFYCFCNTLHTSVGLAFFLQNDSLEISWLSLPCSISSARSSSTVNLKWSVLVCPEFAWHITIQFRIVLRHFHYPILKYFLLAAISTAGCCFERNQPVKYAVNKQSVLWYVKVMSYTISKLQTSAM